MLEHRNLVTPAARLELRAGPNGEATIAGYTSVFHRAGQAGSEYALWMIGDKQLVERFQPGAFDAALRDDDVRCLFNHRSDNVLGRTSAGTVTLRVDAVGLWYECRLPETQCGRDIARMIERRDVTGNSIGFVVRREELVPEGDKLVRNILDVGLFDVGPVTFPAYTGTTVELSRTTQRSLDALAREERSAVAKSRRRSAALARLRRPQSAG